MNEVVLLLGLCLSRRGLSLGHETSLSLHLQYTETTCWATTVKIAGYMLMLSLKKIILHIRNSFVFYIDKSKHRAQVRQLSDQRCTQTWKITLDRHKTKTCILSSVISRLKIQSVICNPCNFKIAGAFRSSILLFIDFCQQKPQVKCDMQFLQFQNSWSI